MLCQLELTCKYRAVTCDSFGNFVLGGENGNVDVYNAEGKRQRHYELSELGTVQSLAIDIDNFLWVGTDQGWIYIVRYLVT